MNRAQRRASKGGWISRNKDPLAYEKALRSVSQITNDQALSLGVAYWSAFRALCDGKGNEDDYHVVVAALNLALMSAEIVLDRAAPLARPHAQALIEDIQKAQGPVLRLYERGKKGKWLFDGEGMSIVRDALLIHDDQLKLLTQGEIVSALRALEKRINDGEVLNDH
jgi:hypothetical protein